MAAYKLDLFKTLLPAIDRRDLDFYERLSEDERSGFTPTVALRAASGASSSAESDVMLILLNSRANLNFYDIADHPELQYKLIASSSVGRLNHQWIPMPGRKKSASSLLTFLSKYWPDASDDELSFLASRFTRDTFIEFVQSCGLSPKDMKDAVEMYDKLNGTGKKDGGKKKNKGKD